MPGLGRRVQLPGLRESLGLGTTLTLSGACARESCCGGRRLLCVSARSNQVAVHSKSMMRSPSSVCSLVAHLLPNSQLEELHLLAKTSRRFSINNTFQEHTSLRSRYRLAKWASACLGGSDLAIGASSNPHDEVRVDKESFGLTGRAGRWVTPIPTIW